MVVYLLVVGVDLDLAPLGIGNPLQNDVEDLENPFADARGKLRELILALYPWGEEVDHGPAYL